MHISLVLVSLLGAGLFVSLLMSGSYTADFNHFLVMAVHKL